MSSKIEWTNETWNPITGCSHVSEGCRYCYAETMAKRLHAMGKPGYTALPWTAQNAKANVFMHADRLDIPRRWTKPRRVFVNSMSDLFHEQVPFEFIMAVFNRMATYDKHTYQVLTKRPARALEFFEYWRADIENNPLHPHFKPPLENVWLGVSVEDQRAADERIPLLLQMPTAVRFLSCEPLLGAVDLTTLPIKNSTVTMNVLHRASVFAPHIHWVITGGESGHHARPMHPDWARSLRDQCAAADVPFFFKQWGEWLHEDQFTNDEQRAIGLGSKRCDFGDDYQFIRVGKHHAGRLLDGVEWNQYPTNE